MGLTGNTRYRSARRWGREILILQVEEVGSEMVHFGAFIERCGFRRWRDAKTTDLPAGRAAIKDTEHG